MLVPSSLLRRPARGLRLACAVLTSGMLLCSPGAALADPVTGPEAAVTQPQDRQERDGIDLETATLPELQAYSARLQGQFVKASLGYEQALATAEQARALAEAKQHDAEAAADAAEAARVEFVRFVNAQYQNSVMSNPTVRTFAANPAGVDALLAEGVVVTQFTDTQADLVAGFEVAQAQAALFAEEADRARVEADAAEAHAQRLLERIKKQAARVATAANKVLLSSAEENTLADAEQRARNQAAVAAWRRYLDRLARAHVYPYTAADLADPAALPRGLSPVLGSRGKPLPGVATVTFQQQAVTVLPQETIRAVSRAFALLGKPYVEGQAGPETFDCAGLTRFVWRQSGYRLAATPDGQWARGQVVRRGDLQVGDSVFLADPAAGVHEVGLYLGGDLMLAADGTAGQVGVLPVPTGQVHAGTRVTLGSPRHRNPVPDSDASLSCGLPTAQPGSATPGGLVIPLPEGTYAFTGEWGTPGPRWSSGYHTGVDLGAPVGTPVFAARDGVVTVRDDQAWAGPHFVTIDHGDGMETWYGHMSRAVVHTGQRVRAGQVIGAVGAEGNVTGPHLHFEVRFAGQDVDPMPFLGGAGDATYAAGVAGWGGYSNGMIPETALCGLATAAGQMLRCDAAHAFDAMSRSYTHAFGEPLCITDSYRSFAVQVQTYAAKPTLAAVPGTSNHGWARAVDLCGGIESFSSREHAWMVRHAGQFGWVHPEWARQGGGREEPWHWEFGRIS